MKVDIQTRFKHFKQAEHYLTHELPAETTHHSAQESFLYKQRLLSSLGKPQNRHKSVHIAATSGKGTFCYLLDSILRAHSLRTGMMVNPHVYDIRERIQLNGQPISEKLFLSSLYEVSKAVNSLGEEPGYFTTLSSMAFDVFANQRLDYILLETGIGGRYDITNTIEKEDKLCILGQIGLDHIEILGGTIESIAAEKAAIIQSKNLVVALKQDDEVNRIFEAEAKKKNAQITWVERSDDYQESNDKLALSAAKILAKRDGWDLDETLAQDVLAKTFIPGRFEKRVFNDHLLILDGAHNPQKISALVSRLQKESISPVTFLLAFGYKKDIFGCLEMLKPAAKRIIATEYFTNAEDKIIPNHPIEKSQIVEIAKSLGIEVSSADNPLEALRLASQSPEPIVATGSFYLLGEIDKSM